MTSDRKREANRANAKKSTGPKSAAGKKRVAQNALRHGLSTGPHSDPSAEAVIDRLTELLADGSRKVHVSHFARMAAEADYDLHYIRNKQLSLIASDPLNADSDRVQMLETFSKYERRALSRRRSSMRELNKLKAP